MPDISMCTNEECKRKDTCYRYKAKPNEYNQSYIWFREDFNPDKCDMYWPLDDDKHLTKQWEER